MDLLCERKQSEGYFTLVPLQFVGGVMFTLWVKSELNKEEKELLVKYSFEDALLIAHDRMETLRKSLCSSVLLSAILWIMLYFVTSFGWASEISIVASRPKLVPARGVFVIVFAYARLMQKSG